MLNSKEEWENVVVTAKVTRLNQIVSTGKNKVKLREAILVDESGLIDVDVWEDNIKKVSIRDCFTFCPLQVCMEREKETFHD